MNPVICTTIDEDLSLNIFSRAKYLVLIKNGEIIHREANPALNSISKRPTVARRCVELGANVVIASHGSLCYPSYQILRRAGVEIYVVDAGKRIDSDLIKVIKPVNLGEVIYSSLLAVRERIMEVFSHGQ
ncbi:hypothetical protein [Vulcanisaeta distributa]|uniref:NifB/NifX family molybdenum-iron cluster-binding protein n=1 Tax=Vulcanisaeta distributa TaxID=164451 RepID=UPI0006CFC3CF|nr:hypothetical protein [Vulcanisaeta distributa]